MRAHCQYCGQEVTCRSIVGFADAMIRHWAECERTPDDLREECAGAMMMRPQQEGIHVDR